MIGSSDAVRSETTSNRRVSGRARVSTTIQVNGHTVLRQNNYEVTAGAYVFSTNEEEDPRKEDDGDATTKAKKQVVKRAQQPRVISDSELARRHHNEAVISATLPKQGPRLAFLARRLPTLQPFLEDGVVEMLQDEREKKQSPREAAKQQQDGTMVEQPEMIQNATMRPYQRKGLEFMVRMHRQNLAMILGDEMGLGKTLQTISLLCHLKEKEGASGPSLVICPLSVLSSWGNEMTKWAPALKYFRLHASHSDEQECQRHHLKEHATEYDVILTTYEMAKVPTLMRLYQRLHFHYLVLDEGHKIKSRDTLISEAVRKIHAGNKLLLTGTPLQNNLVELWSLLNFLYPKIFTTSEPFEKHFNLNDNVIDKQFLGKTQQLLEIFMLRRLKQEVEQSIPDKLETKVYCPLSKSQTFWYKALLMKDVGKLAVMEQKDGPGNTQKHGVTDHAFLNNLFMQLRKCCNHPFLFDGAEIDPDATTVTDLIAASGKLSVLDMLLMSLFKKGHRAVLFSQFTRVLDVLEDYCRLRGWRFCRLDGNTGRARRNYLIRRWNEPESDYFLFLMSCRSGGMGLNLQTADTCILFDSDWNPQNDIQAIGRVHRIGQTKVVHVYRLVSSGTIEERMIERAEKKLLLEMVNRESNDELAVAEEKARGLSASELLEDIKFGSSAVFGDSSDNTLPSWEDIETITDRNRKENESSGKLVGGISKTATTFDATKEYSNSQHFGGADFREIRKRQERELKKKIPKHLGGIAYLWHEIQALNGKRDRKSRIVQLNGAGSGYGKSTVPVLASNNYDLQHGESSVFDRELGTCQKAAFEVKKRKREEVKFENQDHCQVCGDGGFLVCCARCPCSVHLECVGLTDDRQFRCCTHHSCTSCGKNGASVGGLLFPCASCARSFCEDCLPERGVTFLEKVDQFERLGFDQSKYVVYNHCSPQCEQYAVREFGYIPRKQATKGRACPEKLDVSHNFGVTYDIDLDTAQDAVVESQSRNTAFNSDGKRSRRTVLKSDTARSTDQNSDARIKKVEKLRAVTLEFVRRFDSLKAAAESVGSYGSMLGKHLKETPEEPFKGFCWRFQEKEQAFENLCSPTSQVTTTRRAQAAPSTEVYDLTGDEEAPGASSFSVLSANTTLSPVTIDLTSEEMPKTNENSAATAASSKTTMVSSIAASQEVSTKAYFAQGVDANFTSPPSCRSDPFKPKSHKVSLSGSKALQKGPSDFEDSL